uniref:Alpha-1,3-glucosyltransferase n=1 Tax=Cucumis melo subsp. melo TaxID=412675 RepID=E5GC95_CUCME|nr:dolichyl glycosyltransferase [Cucumis melo subsp. melo]
MEENRREDFSKGPTPRKPLLELLWFYAVAACIKLLLIPSYHSTDFEVHRHWLALTHSLPLSQWYFDDTSQWTLDYPPFFAYFERFLSIFANIVDPQIVHLQKGLDYNTNTVIYFQRITVIVSDLCLLYGVYRLTKNLDPIKRKLIWVLVIWSPALVIVDHLHFQYNGFLLGMLLISLSYLEEGRDLMGGFVFAVLLCFKHLFAVAAPVYFVYLLRHYCRGGFVRGFGRLTIMGSVVVAVFAAAYGPFIYHGQITPLTTFVVVLLALSPCLIKAFKDPQPRKITRWVAYAYACGFLFGWHVHEKASLHFVIPLAVAAVQSLEDARHYFLLSIVSCYSLFPLLFEAQEYPIKVLLLLLHSSLMWLGFSAQFDKGESVKQTGSKSKRHVQKKGSMTATGEPFCIRFVEKVYLVGLLVVEIWAQFLHPFILGGKFPFVPLMLISTYCSLGVMYSWIWQLRWILKPATN